MRVLLVDDDGEIREVIKRRLEIDGHEVIEAKDGHHGLCLFVQRRNSIDLVITDLQMPVYNGHKLAHEIRKLNKTVPILLHTAAINVKANSDITKIIGKCDYESMKLFLKNDWPIDRHCED